MTCFCVFTQPNKEHLASEHLEWQGYEVYVPTFRRWVNHARVRIWAARPLFPRYLFVAFDPKAKPASPIRSTSGVRWLIGQGNEPLPVEDDLINKLRMSEEMGIFDETAPQAPPWLKPGTLVRITEGLFAGFVGELRGKADKERIQVLLSLLGRATPVHIPVAHLECVSP